MPRKPREASTSGFYHLMARGVNKKKIFHREDDYEYYLKLLTEYSQRLGVQIYHYCLMPNHTHVVLWAENLVNLSRLAHYTHRRYAYYYCQAHQWSEQVFRRRFTSLPILRDSHLLECGRYVERNPVKAKIVDAPDKYPYSSYAFYAQSKSDPLLTRSPLYESLGQDETERMAAYRFYVCQERGSEAEELTMYL